MKKIWKDGFSIIVVYVDDINIIGTPEELPKAIDCLKNEFEMKDLEKTKFCLGLQIKYFKNKNFMHQGTCIAKLIKRFHMDNSYLLCTPMVLRSLDVNKDSFRSKEKEFLGPKVPYISAMNFLVPKYHNLML